MRPLVLHPDTAPRREAMLRAVLKLSLEGKTVDAVKHILAIAERERRKRALKEAPGQPPPLSTPLDKDQDQHLEKGSKPWTPWQS
jgi:hypothetical protein